MDLSWFDVIGTFIFHLCSVLNTIKMKGFVVQCETKIAYSYVYNVCKHFVLFTGILHYFRM